MPAFKRDQLVDTALDLFEQSGFQAVGIDRVLSEAGVAKMTLYKYFPSKDHLIVAALQQKDRTHRLWFINQVEQRASEPRERLLAMFQTLRDMVDQPAYPGCIFARAAAEFGEVDHPVHVAAVDHKRWLRQYIATLAAAAGAGVPEKLAFQLTSLMDGAMAIRQIGGCEGLCDAVYAAAQTLIDAAVVVPAA